YWAYLFGGLIFYASFFFGEVPDAGWFSYTPLSGPKYAGIGLDFWLLGLGLVEISGIATGVEIVVTILKFRAMGMSLNRMPLFVWTLLAMGLMIVFAFTTLLTATFMLELDRTVGTNFFNPNRGGSSLLWQHLFWFFGHPEVYIIFLPATGIVSTLVGAFSKRSIVGYNYVVAAIVVTAFVSFGLWAHHMFTTGLPELASGFFTAASLAIGIATGVQVFAWIATLWGSKPSFSTPMLYLLGFFFIFVLGGLTGIMLAVAPFDWQVHDTFFVVAHFHYVLIGGVVFPAIGGLYFWLPKITGKMLNEKLGKWGFWVAFVGFNATFFPMHIMGLLGMPRRVYTYQEELGLDGYNLAATIGAFIFAVGILIFALDALYSLFRGRPATSNPWNAGTLEWSVSSKPPIYSFYRPPIVKGVEPLWTESSEPDPPEFVRVQNALTWAPARWRGALVTDALKGLPQSIQWMPGPSLIPLRAAFGLLILFSALLVKFYIVSAAALVFTLGVVARWFWTEGPYIKKAEAEEIEKSSGLPVFSDGPSSVAWWGVLGFVAVMGTVFGALFFSYFYLWLYSDQWPQGGEPLPTVVLPAAGVCFLIGAATVQVWALSRAKKQLRKETRLSMFFSFLLGLGYLSALGITMAASPLNHKTNAYSSAFYVINAFMFASAFVAVAYSAGAQLKIFKHLQNWKKSFLFTQISTFLWSFNLAAGVAVFAVLHLSARVIAI
ncbi:MAG: cbb3-type cytochrome c oxidase subunit I, partial [Bacteriovoracaceae bacterium]